MQQEQWLYIPKSSLTVESDLFKTRITNISEAAASTPHLQDRAIVEDYTSVQQRYNNVIGILAVYDDEPLIEEHSRFRREHPEYKKFYVYVAAGEPKSPKSIEN